VKISKLLFIASWVLLVLMSVGVALASIGSISVAYGGGDDNFGGVRLEDIRTAMGDEMAKALRARRATAASWSFAAAILSGWIALVPYRRGQRWAWWALLAFSLPHFASLARVIAIGTSLGAATSGIVLAFLLLALLAGTPRMFGGPLPAERA
jgi:hypothetical protein